MRYFISYKNLFFEDGEAISKCLEPIILFFKSNCSNQVYVIGHNHFVLFRSFVHRVILECKLIKGVNRALVMCCSQHQSLSVTNFETCSHPMSYFKF